VENRGVFVFARQAWPRHSFHQTVVALAMRESQRVYTLGEARRQGDFLRGRHRAYPTIERWHFRPTIERGQLISPQIDLERRVVGDKCGDGEKLLGQRFSGPPCFYRFVIECEADAQGFCCRMAHIDGDASVP